MGLTIRKICVLGLAGALGLIAGGCSTRVAVGGAGGGAQAHLSGEPADAGSGPAWDGVMPGEFLATDSGEGDLARRDAALNLQTGGPLLASTEWPHAPRPLFERPRRVHLPRQPENVLQFLPPRTAR